MVEDILRKDAGGLGWERETEVVDSIRSTLALHGNFRFVTEIKALLGTGSEDTRAHSVGVQKK